MAERTCRSLSQPSDGDSWGWFHEFGDIGGTLGGSPDTADPPVSKATPSYILTVGRFVCWKMLTLGYAR